MINTNDLEDGWAYRVPSSPVYRGIILLALSLAKLQREDITTEFRSMLYRCWEVLTEKGNVCPPPPFDSLCYDRTIREVAIAFGKENCTPEYLEFYQRFDAPRTV
jgi:hypothetical protein